jgi:arginyl-tRNA synthetase
MAQDMYNTNMKKELKNLLQKAIMSVKEANNWSDFDVPEISIEYTKDERFGDYTANIAMVLAKKIGQSPMEIAEILRGEILKQVQDDSLEKVEVAAPGYINFYLSKKYLHSVAKKINIQKNNFGNSKIGKGTKVNNEFISANPTGPLHLGNGRGGFFGDSLSRVLKKTGFDVANEYYVNDAGEQLMKLGHSVLKDKEAVYAGEYIKGLNIKVADYIDVDDSARVKKIGKEAAQRVLENFIKKTVSQKMDISFDAWQSEQELYDKGFVDRALQLLSDKKLTFEQDGALWLRTTGFGDDKDRVLVKSDGQKTYFASDCGYILSKMERGFGRIIESWGADHHGYIVRFRAAAKALGFEGELRFIIVQLVKLVKDGKEVRMSKRAGNVVYIDDLINEIGHDVTRFFFLMYSPDTHMNFDLGLAKERSQKNPVFYVQYAHARICSILEKAQNIDYAGADVGLLVHEKELSLIKELDKFPQLVEEIAGNYEVHKLAHYAIRLADKFHSFYDACRVIDEENSELSRARLLLVNAVRIVLAGTLELIGVSAPNKM